MVICTTNRRIFGQQGRGGPWTPEGNSGNGGGGVCEAGYVNLETGYWKHLRVIGQEAWRLARGEEQEEIKVVVPTGIHKEMFAGWKAQ